MNEYDIGDTIRFTANFYDNNGNLADPSDPTFVLYPPSHISGTYVYGVDAEVKRMSTGTYYMDVVGGFGVYLYKAYSTSTIVASSDEGEVFVR